MFIDSYMINKPAMQMINPKTENTEAGKFLSRDFFLSFLNLLSLIACALIREC